ncbi:hypothetical protein [Streptomyces sp. NPDC001816]|uniref:hypothetical protein n=1 Tax=Streptomyces sp. NPDC001816 TaxID=3364612 RepID=UPI00367808EB
MDQGAAAVFAGVAGLIGAGIGGLATAYGARIGAQKSIEAVGLQVQRQSAAEHGHWVREQRREVCVSFIDAFVRYAKGLVDCSKFVNTRTVVPSDTAADLSDSRNSLIILRGHLQLWGPQAVVDAAFALTDAVRATYDWVEEWYEILESGDESHIDSHIARDQELTTSLGAARLAFVATARDVLGTPT